MIADRKSLLYPGRWMAATMLLALAAVPPAPAQDINYPPQAGYGQPNSGQQPYGQPGDPSQGDPPSRVARVSVAQGNVSLQPSGVEDFSPASLNYPLTTGDRIYSDNGALTELEAGQLAVRLGSATDLSVTAMTDQLVQFGLGQGSIHVRSYDFDPNGTLEVDTPNVSVTVLAPGDLRVDVSPDGTTTQVTLISGQARVDGPGFQQQLQPGESLQMTGSQPVYAQDVRRPRGDNLDRFSGDRDRTYQDAIAMQSDYINPGTIGAADLGQYGDWSNDSDNGAVWYPRGVSADWQPYSVGRWAYVAPWGWTWVENEPWGFAPFHYGRWARFGPRWGWIPGPRIVRPVYSPALVAFVGGGVGVTAWFPLGPREPYVPWYRTSPLYANRINVTNIYSRNTVEVRNIYNQRTTNVYVNNASFNRGYANRQLATVAVPQNAFAGGRPVREVAMHLSPQQFANSPVLARPNATPTRGIMAPAAARALPPHINRPPVESRAPGFGLGGNNRLDRGGFGRGASGQVGFGQGSGQPNSSNRGGGFGNQPGTAGSNFPYRGNTPQQPGQQPPGPQQPGQTLGGYPRAGDPGRSDRPVQNPPGSGATSAPGQAGASQYPNRGNDGGQVPRFRGEPVRTGPMQPSPGLPNQVPSRGSESGQAPPFRAEPGRPVPTPVSPVPVSPTPGNQVPNRGNGSGQPSPFRGDPGRTTAPTPGPVAPTQPPNRDGQGPVFRGAPGHTTLPTPVQPVNQPPAGNNASGGDFHPRSGAHPVIVPPETGQGQQQPPGGARPWQQQQPANAPSQNRPQTPMQQFPVQPPRQFQPQPQPAAQPQQPRFQPQPAPSPQPQRQFQPPQAPRPQAPAPAPHENHPAHEVDKHR